MRVAQIRLSQYRNIDFVCLNLRGKNSFLVGENGQGKTNLLEAIGFVTALRSFRSQENTALIKHKAKQAELFMCIEHEHLGAIELHIQITPKEKIVYLNKEKKKRFSDFLGCFPTIVLASEDIGLLKGAPLFRRKFIDLTLSITDKNYFNLLKRYYKLLKERNFLLRKPTSLDPTFYDELLSQTGVQIIHLRTEFLKKFNRSFTHYYETISLQKDQIQLLYEPNVEESDFCSILKSNFERDQILKSTQRGPHRDDFLLKIDGESAKSYGSEGQQRSIVLAMRLAQRDFFKACLKVEPVVLADDILGQLDSGRVEAFWHALGEGAQVFSTGTQFIKGKNCHRSWLVFNVISGQYNLITTE